MRPTWKPVTIILGSTFAATAFVVVMSGLRPIEAGGLQVRPAVVRLTAAEDSPDVIELPAPRDHAPAGLIPTRWDSHPQMIPTDINARLLPVVTSGVVIAPQSAPAKVDQLLSQPWSRRSVPMTAGAVSSYGGSASGSWNTAGKTGRRWYE